MRAIIIDDEPAAIDSIEELVLQLAPDVQLVSRATNGLEAMQQILQLEPDLIFLDVDLPFMNGLQLMEKIPVYRGEIIFTTGSSSYALMALKLNAADYLVKPIDPADFLLAMSKVRSRLAHRKLPAAEPINRIQLPTQHAILYLDEKEIVSVVGKGSYCQINTLNGEKITVSKSIGQVEEKLSATRFFRCHNSYIINLDYVTMFNSRDGNHVVLKEGLKAEVSRRSKEMLLERLAERSK